MPTLIVNCAGCGSTFYSAAGDLWCAKCEPTVKPFAVNLSADQRRQIDTLAIVRGVTPEDVLRLGLAALAGRTKSKPLPQDEPPLAEKPRRGTAAARKRPS